MIQGSASPYQVVAPMTYATAAELFACRQALLLGKETVFDFAAVPNADSSALSVILAWQRAAGEGRLRLRNLPQSVMSLAKLYDVDELLSLA